GEHVTLGGFAAVEVQDNHGLAVAPWRRVRIFLGRAVQLEGSVGRKLYSLGREQSRGLMMPVASVHAAPAVNYNSGAEAADHADHIFDDLIAPDPFRFLRRLRKAKIFGASEEKPQSVAARGRQQFLCADQSEFWCLFVPKVVLSALPARQATQSHIRMQPAGTVRWHCAALI